MPLRHSIFSTVVCFILLSLTLLSADSSFGLEPVVVPTVPLELHRFASPSAFDSPGGILVNRNNQVATTVRLLNQDDYLVYYAPGSLATQTAVPNHERVLGFDFGNWGTAVATDQNGGLPMAMYTGQFAAPLNEIFRNTALGDHTRPAINDSGTVAFNSRVINHHGLRDVWRWRPGETAQMLPDLGEDALGQTVLIDNSERISTVHDFPTPTFVSDLYRFNPVGGWQNLTAAFSEYPTQNPFEARSRTINAQGDIIFASEEAVFPNPNYYVNFFKTSDGSIQRIANITRMAGGQTAPQLVLATIGDGGEALLAIGGTDQFDPNVTVLFRTPDGTITNLSSLLPAGEAFGIFPFRPQGSLNQSGQMLLQTQDTTTQLFSYFFYDSQTGVFLSPSSLANLPQPVQSPTLSGDGRVYYWVDEGSESAFFVVPVPEPATLWLCLGSAACYCLRCFQKSSRRLFSEMSPSARTSKGFLIVGTRVAARSSCSNRAASWSNVPDQLTQPLLALHDRRFKSCRQRRARRLEPS